MTPPRAWDSPDATLLGLLLGRFTKVFSVDALARVSSFLLVPAYLALMTKEAFASFGYLVAVIGVVSLSLNLGVYVSQTSLYNEVGPGERGRLLFTLNALLIVFLGLVGAVMYGLGLDVAVSRWVFSEQIPYERYRWLVPLGVIVAIFGHMLLNFYLASEQLRRVQELNVARLLLGTVLTLAAVAWVPGDGAATRLSAFLLSECLVLAIFAVPYVKAMRRQFDSGLALRSLRLGIPIMLSAVLGVATNFGDKYFVEKLCDLPQLGVYFLGLTCAGVISTVFMSFQSVWLPLFLKEKNVDTNISRTTRLLPPLLAALCGLSGLVWGVVWVAVRTSLIGPDYAAVLSVLPVLLLASVCSSIAGVFSAYTIYWKMTHVTIIVGCVVAALSVPANLLLIGSYGVLGAAWSTVLLNATYAAGYALFIWWRLRQTVRGITT